VGRKPGAVSVTSWGEPGAGAEGEWEVEAEAEGEAEAVPHTHTFYLSKIHHTLQ